VELRRFFTRVGRIKRRTGGDDITAPIPEGLNWFVWRVLTHDRSNATLREVEEHWSLVDLVNANLALDVHDELQRLSYEQSKKT
jgi:hypothetical protein